MVSFYNLNEEKKTNLKIFNNFFCILYYKEWIKRRPGNRNEAESEGGDGWRHGGWSGGTWQWQWYQVGKDPPCKPVTEMASAQPFSFPSPLPQKNSDKIIFIVL